MVWPGKLIQQTVPNIDIVGPNTVNTYRTLKYCFPNGMVRQTNTTNCSKYWHRRAKYREQIYRRAKYFVNSGMVTGFVYREQRYLRAKYFSNSGTEFRVCRVFAVFRVFGVFGAFKMFKAFRALGCLGWLRPFHLLRPCSPSGWVRPFHLLRPCSPF